MRHFSARFVERNYSANNVCVILDGDQSSSERQQINDFKSILEQKHNVDIDIEK